MTPWERFTTAFGVLMHGKTAYEFTNTWDQGQVTYTSANYQNNVIYGLRRNELIYACIMMKADSASVTSLAVRRRKDGQELPDHACKAVLAKPNPYMTEFDFMSITLLMLDLAGRATWEKQRSKAGRVVGLWPLRPDLCQPVKGPNGLPIGYQYAASGVAQPIPLDTSDVLEFKLWDPLDLFSGLAPVSVAGRIGDVDNAATDYLKKFFEQGGIPPGILSSKLKLNDPAVADIRRRWKERYGGWQNWTEPAVLDSDASYQRTGLGFEEMGFDVLDARSEARICAVLGVPAILVGAKVGLDRSTFSNAEQAEKYFWQHTLLPLYKRIDDELQNDLASEFGADIELVRDLSQVPALQEDQDAKWKRAHDGLSVGGLTVNEYRAQLALPAVANGDVFLRTLSQVEVPAMVVKGKKALGCEHQHKATPPDDDDERRKSERALEAAMVEYFDAQLGRIKKAV